MFTESIRRTGKNEEVSRRPLLGRREDQQRLNCDEADHENSAPCVIAVATVPASIGSFNAMTLLCNRADPIQSPKSPRPQKRC